jgi:hypothetical protein
MCTICEKRFKTIEFVNKHIFNKHEEKFAKFYSSIAKHNYMSDPNKLVNQPYFNESRNQGGYRDRRHGDYRSRYDNNRGYDKDREDKKRETYVDHDDPSKHANSERKMVSYDDLF